MVPASPQHPASPDSTSALDGASETPFLAVSQAVVPHFPPVARPNHTQEAAFIFLCKVAGFLNHGQVEPGSGFPDSSSSFRHPCDGLWTMLEGRPS